MEWLIRNGGRAENVPGYDCSSSNRESGRRNYVLGIAFIAYGLVAEIVYTLVLMAMLRRNCRSLPSYKIMIALGLYDMAIIFVNCILTGYFWMTGANYCTNPTFMYIVGSVALGLWCGSCMNSLILAVNRLLQLKNKYLMLMVFKDSRVYAILLMPLSYCLYFCLFTGPVIFNSDNSAWFFFTFAPDHRPEEFHNYSHAANFFMVVVTCFLYALFLRSLLRPSKIGRGLTWSQKSCFIQCSSICAVTLMSSLMYIYMQFFPTHPYIVLIGHIGWQLIHVLPAFIYALLNRTVQRELVFILYRRDPHI